MMDLQSGDLLLCHGVGWVSSFLQYIGQSKYSHVGIILKNPKFLCETLEDGLYVWDSSYGTAPEDENHTIRFGVQIHKLDYFMSLYPKESLYVRKIDYPRNDDFHTKLINIHKEVHGKPYNTHIMDWISAKLNMVYPFSILSIWKYTDRFWCSALVTYIYVQLGWISDANWGLIAPREFSSKESTGQLLFTCIVHDEELLH